MKTKINLFAILLLILAIGCTEQSDNETVQHPQLKMTTDIPEGITTPDKVETSIGTLEFFDGVPTKATSENVYDYLDRMRGVDVFLKGMPGASVQAMILGLEEAGADQYNRVVVTKKLLDSKSLFLTANTSTIYITPHVDLKKNGPLVMETPPGMLGAFNDAWFRYVADIGPFGEDKGQGGKYLMLPPGYEGEIPTGYFIVKSPTFRMFIFMRTSIANGIAPAVEVIENNMKVYPLYKKENPADMEFVDMSGMAFNTIHTNDYSFYVHLNEWIQQETVGMLDAETRGLFASIGIEKGKEFAPDDRMKKILTDAVAIGNAAARSITWYPRVDGILEGSEIYPGTNSCWMMGWVNKNVFFTTETGGMNSDARVLFHYPYTAVTPAMAVSIPGAGSDYGMAFLDADKNYFNGSKTYKLHIPANVPVKDFWAVTIYDSQTRSMLQTNQQFPTVGSQSEGFKQNKNGSTDIYFGPTAPEGWEGNWLQSIPGKGWFVIFRVYGPLEPWIDKSWRPGEIELID